MDNIDKKMSYTLLEGVLNDDILHIANAGYKFKGGYIAILEYYTYLNEWCNKKHFKGFKNMETMEKYINKKYPSHDIELCQYDNE